MSIPVETSARDRKAEHIQLALEDAMQVRQSTFDAWHFEHNALPELDRAEIDLSCSYLGKPLKAPLLISCMTGGTGAAAKINHNLAVAAERCGVALGVGSQRKALEDPEQAETFKVRELCPSIPLIGNLGAVQLNYGYGLAECEAAVRMIDADALALHLNVLQEAIQPEGQCNFSGLIEKMSAVQAKLSVPVIVKEIGSGLSKDVGQRLKSAGFTYLDSAGVGGTSWARIEARRAGDVPLGELFADWGIDTPESIRQLTALGDVSVIGSGGVRNGVEAAKCIALGAHLAGAAYPFLEAATQSVDAVVARIERMIEELEICMFCIGARTIPDLQSATLHKAPQ